METIVARVDPVSPEADVISRAGRILKEGGLVAFPTETVYGLGGDALNPESSRKIYAAKGRPSDNPLIVHIADTEALPFVAAKIPEGAERLMAEYWPGPLTMIFEKTDAVPYETTGGLSTVAVRMPSHPVARALIRAEGGYIAAPSANLSGRPSTTTAAHVIEDLHGRIDMILDGGAAAIGLESTIVDFTEKVPTVLRPGFISLPMLKDVLGEVLMDPGLNEENTGVRPKAPGMRYRHYAPKAPLILVEGSQEAVISLIRKKTEEAEAEGKNVWILCTEETGAKYRAGHICPIGSLKHEEEIAAKLFDALRHFDETHADLIFSEAFDTPQLGAAIMNRLLKAAGHTVLFADRETERI